MESPEQQLQALRARIDMLDESLARLLIERTGIIHEVAALKRANWPKACHIRPGREGQMHRAITERFTGTDFPPLAALAIWRQLIGASTHLESPLGVSYLAQFPDHRWLAREYFGPQVGHSAAVTLDGALAAIQNNERNILLLPLPSQQDWSRDAEKILDAGLALFAILPAVDSPDIAPALAFAALEAEPSGDDISYHLRNGRIETIDGFVPAQPGTIFIGAHPRPIRSSFP